MPLFSIDIVRTLCGRLRIKAIPIRALRPSGADGRKRQQVFRSRPSAFLDVSVLHSRRDSAASETTMSFAVAQRRTSGRCRRRCRFVAVHGEVADQLLRQPDPGGSEEA
jgi:hypothetical protein